MSKRYKFENTSDPNLNTDWVSIKDFLGQTNLTKNDIYRNMGLGRIPSRVCKNWRIVQQQTFSSYSFSSSLPITSIEYDLANHGITPRRLKLQTGYKPDLPVLAKRDSDELPLGVSHHYESMFKYLPANVKTASDLLDLISNPFQYGYSYSTSFVDLVNFSLLMNEPWRYPFESPQFFYYALSEFNQLDIPSIVSQGREDYTGLIYNTFISGEGFYSHLDHLPDPDLFAYMQNPLQLDSSCRKKPTYMHNHFKTYYRSLDESKRLNQEEIYRIITELTVECDTSVHSRYSLLDRFKYWFNESIEYTDFQNQEDLRRLFSFPESDLYARLRLNPTDANGVINLIIPYPFCITSIKYEKLLPVETSFDFIFNSREFGLVFAPLNQTVKYKISRALFELQNNFICPYYQNNFPQDWLSIYQTYSSSNLEKQFFSNTVGKGTVVDYNTRIQICSINVFWEKCANDREIKKFHGIGLKNYLFGLANRLSLPVKDFDTFVKRTKVLYNFHANLGENSETMFRDYYVKLKPDLNNFSKPYKNIYQFEPYDA